MLAPPHESGAAYRYARLGVDAVYVLSVKSFGDRIAHVTRELSGHGIDFEFIFDFDAADLDPHVVALQFEDWQLRPPHRSLVLKHIQAWRLACQRQHRRILVFEDDVLLHKDFSTLLSQALLAADTITPGWLVYLGGADTKVPDSFFRSGGPLIPLQIATADGYVTDLTACRERVAWCEANKIALPADHLIRHIDNQCGIRHYWLSEAIIEQGSVTGLFNSVLDGHRIKHGQLYNRLRYLWNKLHRRQIRRWWTRLTRT